MVHSHSVMEHSTHRMCHCSRVDLFQNKTVQPICLLPAAFFIHHLHPAYSGQQLFLYPMQLWWDQQKSELDSAAVAQSVFYGARSGGSGDEEEANVRWPLVSYILGNIADTDFVWWNRQYISGIVGWQHKDLPVYHTL